MRPGPRRGVAASAQSRRRSETNADGTAARLGRIRVALRIARRSSVRSPGRSALIVALVALPVAGMAAVSLVIPSTVPADAERLTVELGHSQAMVQVVSDFAVEQDPFSSDNWRSTKDASNPPPPGKRQTLSEILPSDTRMIPVLSTNVTLKTRTGVGAMGLTEGETWDPSLAGHYRVAAGRTPHLTDEVMASAAALNRLGLAIGNQAELVAPVSRKVRIVGVLTDRSQSATDEAIFGMPGVLPGDADITQNPQTVTFLPDTVVDWKHARNLNNRGAVVLSRDVFAHPPKPGSYSYFSGGSGNGMLYLMSAIIIGFALMEVMLLAGAAFMVGARAQERSLATVASVGSTRSTLLAIITSNGLVLGAIGGLIGVGAGIGIGSLFMRLTDDGSATQYWGYHLSWVLMLGIAVAAVFVGWLGALVPAIRASNIDVVAALRGARRPAPARRRHPIIGLVLALAGIAITLLGGTLLIVLSNRNTGNSPWYGVATGMLVGGPILVQIGLILCSALVLRVLARVFSGAGIAARLASRDAARNPGRSVPALAVVMTTVFVAIFAMTMISSSEATSRDNYQYNAVLGQTELDLSYWDGDAMKTYAHPRQFEAALRGALDVNSARVLRSVDNPARSGAQVDLPAGVNPGTLLPTLTIPPANQCPSDMTSINYDPAALERGTDAYKRAAADWRCQDQYVLYGDGQRLVVGDARELAFLIGAEPSAAARAALESGGAVALHRQFVDRGKVTVSSWTAAEWQKSNGSKLPAPGLSQSVDAVVQKTDHPLPYGIFVAPVTAARLGLSYSPSRVLASTKTPPTQPQIDALNQRIDGILGTPGSFHALVERGPTQSAGAWAWGLLGLSTLVAIGAAAIAIGLARADGRRDQAALSAVGASPGIRRGFGFWQAIVLAGTGSVLGAAVGLVPALALTLPGAATDFSAPWLQIAASATLMPLAIACAAWLLTGRSKLQLRRAAIE